MPRSEAGGHRLSFPNPSLPFSWKSSPLPPTRISPPSHLPAASPILVLKLLVFFSVPFPVAILTAQSHRTTTSTARISLPATSRARLSGNSLRRSVEKAKFQGCTASMICIGPVCVPAWHVWMVLALIAKPVWEFLRGLCARRRDGGDGVVGGSADPAGSSGTLVVGREAGQEIELTQVKEGGQLRRRLGVGESGRGIFTVDFPRLLHLSSSEQLDELKKTLLARTRRCRRSVAEGVEGGLKEAAATDDAPGGGDGGDATDVPPIVIDFSATWCKPCKAISPLFEELAGQHDGLFIKCDVDECPELAEEVAVSALPTFCILGYSWKDGRWTTLGQLQGAVPRSLRELIARHVPATGSSAN